MSAPRRPRRPIETRRSAAAVIATLAAVMGWLPGVAAAPPAESPVTIGVSLALTGPDARWGAPMLRGVELAVEDLNRGGGAGGHPLRTVVLDSAGPGLEGISRWRGMNNYERLIADPSVVAVVGPQTSGEGRAVAPLLSRAELATITPSATTFDVTDPSTRDRFRPGGRAVYFRTVGTGLAQGPAMARFAHDRLGVRRVVLVDDGTEFGVRIVETFARQADDLGITVLARKQIPWTEGDYRPRLRELKALNPQALYFAGNQPVGVKVARQVAEILPSVHRLAAETLYDRAFPIQAGAAADGWHVSNVAPDLAADAATAAWAERFQRRFGEAPSSYSLTAYTAVTVIGDAVARLAKRGRPITRAGLREAVEATRLPDSVQGPVSFDANGDLAHPVVSIYQVKSGAFVYVETVTGPAAARMPAPRARP
ncbi:MAG TPA: branched-chain amino acid ABC transporter substrate-binding protein [Methylomirabilota bacterium]